MQYAHPVNTQVAYSFSNITKYKKCSEIFESISSATNRFQSASLFKINIRRKLEDPPFKQKHYKLTTTIKNAPLHAQRTILSSVQMSLNVRHRNLLRT